MRAYVETVLVWRIDRELSDNPSLPLIHGTFVRLTIMLCQQQWRVSNKVTNFIKSVGNTKASNC